MIAFLKHPQPFDLLRHTQLMAEARLALTERRRALLVTAMGFICFMPYPAINVGNATAIQIGNLLTLLMAIPCLLIPWKRLPIYIFPLLLAPLFLSALRVAMFGDGDVVVAFKEINIWAISAMAMLAAQLYAPEHALELLIGIAVATLVHVGVGFYQFYSFAVSQELPLVQLYINQSFLSVQDNATIIARYTQRPFGLFPEPSAMSASLAPFVLFWTAHLCGLVHLHRQPSYRHNLLFGAAALGGIGLMIISRSGHTAVTVAAAAVFCVIWLIRARATPRNYLASFMIFGAAMPLAIALAGWVMSDRLGGNSQLGNSSWEERTSSLLTGFRLMMEHGILSAILGIGPGQMSPAMWDAVRINAVFSILLTYIYETGMVGIAAICLLGQYLLKVWKSLRFDLVFVAITAVWLVGITLTTSYTQLLPLWIALGWLTVWPEFCGPAPRSQPAANQLPSSLKDRAAGEPAQPGRNRWRRS